MPNSLGIFVSSNKHFDKVIKLCRAAKNKGVNVTLFFTHLGILLTQDPRFAELEGLDISICKVGFEGHGFKPTVPSLDEKHYTTQAMHAEMIDDCDRYVVF
jgi:hypothetical protein